MKPSVASDLISFRRLGRLLLGILIVIVIVAGPLLGARYISANVCRVDDWDCASAVSWLAGVAHSFFPWPFLLVSAAIVLFCSSRARDRLYSFIESVGLKIGLGDASLELSARSAQSAELRVTHTFETLARYRDKLRNELQTDGAYKELDAQFQALVGKHPFSSVVQSDFRCTIHIPDFLFKDRLYQLLNYIPSNTGAHRNFSQRRGIMGRVWRSKLPEYVGNLLPKGVSIQPGNKALEERYVAQHWGFTQEEARHSLRHRSYCCFILADAAGDDVGLVYMDHTNVDAFGNTDPERDQFYKDALELFRREGIGQKVGKILNRMHTYSAEIDLDKYGNR